MYSITNMWNENTDYIGVTTVTAITPTVVNLIII